MINYADCPQKLKWDDTLAKCCECSCYFDEQIGEKYEIENSTQWICPDCSDFKLDEFDFK